MPLLDKTFSEITIQDIQDLITNEVTENQKLEYKKIPWQIDGEIGNTEQQIKEMLKDVSSIANKLGGYIILGIEEDSATGKALALHGIENAEDIRDRIFSALIANIQPKILGLNIKCVEAPGNGKIIIIYIPNSSRKPHMVAKGLNQFWMRHDRQKSIMSVEDIRDEFFRGIQATEKIDSFLNKRADYFLKLGINGHNLVISALPLNNFEEIIDINNPAIRELLRTGSLSQTDAWNLDLQRDPRPSLNGLTVDIEDYKKIELFRTGFLEYKINIENMLLSNGGRSEEEDLLNGRAVVESIYNYLLLLQEIADSVGYEGQYLLRVNFYSIHDYGLFPYRLGAIGNREAHRWQEVNLELPTMVYEYIEPSKIAKEMGDRIWQAFGFENEPFYRDNEFHFDR